MERLALLIRRAGRPVALAVAVLLLLLDLVSSLDGASLALPISAVVVVWAALADRDLRLRVSVATVASVVATVAIFLSGVRPASFGLAEAAGLGLLLVLATRRLPVAVARWAVSALGIVLAVQLSRSATEGVSGGALALLMMCLGLATAVGIYLRFGDDQRARELDRVRSDERLELARELHDSVAHHVTGIMVRAQAAQVVGGARPDQALDALGAIGAESVEALTSMRRLVGMLRESEAPISPPAGLEQIRQLVARFAEGGLAPVLRLGPGIDDSVLTAEVGASVHRIVQESLTNVRRHAPDARNVEIGIERTDGAVTVGVADDGHGASTALAAGGGFGLVGLAERVALLGGRLHAGPGPGGGWEVVAEVPLAGMVAAEGGRS